MSACPPGRAGVADGIDAGLQVERHGVAHDGEVLVVNGERGLGAGVDRQRDGDEEGRSQFFHNGTGLVWWYMQVSHHE